MRSKTLDSAWNVTKGAILKWISDEATRSAAALSYYTVFSIGPLMLIVLGVVGLFFGKEVAHRYLWQNVESLTGPAATSAVRSIVASSNTHTDLLASAIGVVVLLVGATGVFVELKTSLNKIWGVEARKSSGIFGFLKDRLISFAMVLAIGFLLLVSFILTTLLAAITQQAGTFIPVPPFFAQATTFAVTFVMETVLFGMIFKVLPECDVRWRDVAFGAAVTALLFNVGKFLIGQYLARAGSSLSAFGAAASLVLLMLWAYYSSLILLFGAELTVVRARRAREQSGPASDLQLVSAGSVVS